MVASCSDFSEAVLIRDMQGNCQSLGGLCAAEEGLLFRDIAEVIGQRLNVPVVRKATENAVNHFGWFTAFAATEMSASSQRTRKLLGWQPKQPGLIADIERGSYFETQARGSHR